jgi:hypothetical protein
VERFPGDRQFNALRPNERDEPSLCHDSGLGSRVNRSRGRRVSVGSFQLAVFSFQLEESGTFFSYSCDSFDSWFTIFAFLNGV